MGEQSMAYIGLTVIITILTNIIINAIKKIIDIRNLRRERNNFGNQDYRQQTLILPQDRRTSEPITTDRSANVPAIDSQRNTTPPPLPIRVNATIENVYDYPKCYLHKCRNRPGEPQMVFWDGRIGKYKCHRGHYFTGRE